MASGEGEGYGTDDDTIKLIDNYVDDEDEDGDEEEVIINDVFDGYRDDEFSTSVDECDEEPFFGTSTTHKNSLIEPIIS